MRRTLPVSNIDADDERQAPQIDDSQLPKPLTLTVGRPASVSVDVYGVPPPIVQWLVGRRRVKETARYKAVASSVFWVVKHPRDEVQKNTCNRVGFNKRLHGNMHYIQKQTTFTYDFV